MSQAVDTTAIKGMVQALEHLERTWLQNGGNMGVSRFFAAVGLVVVPAGVLAQEPAAGFATAPDPASVDPQLVFLTLADPNTRGKQPRIVIPVGTFEMLSAQALEQTAAQGRWQTVDAWPPGEQILITLKTGDDVEGAFKYATLEELFLTDATGKERRIAKAEVRQVKGEKKDTSVDGALLGAAVGAGFGALFGYGRRTFECRSGCSIAIGTTLFTPVGAFVGWLRDRKRNNIEILYDAP